MAINLRKGDSVKVGLQLVNVVLGWDTNNSSGYDYDLDASAFMLAGNKKLPADEFFVFYNNLQSSDGAVASSGDDLDGGEGEILSVDLSKVDQRVQEILFTVTIHDAENRRQNFGQVRNSRISIINALTNEEIACYDLDEDFSTETAVEFGRLVRRDGHWEFEAIGNGFKGGLEFLVNKYAY